MAAEQADFNVALQVGNSVLAALLVDKALVHTWVRETALAVSDFYQGFPVARTLLTIVPVPGAESVVHGKVLPESSPGWSLADVIQSIRCLARGSRLGPPE